MGENDAGTKEEVGSGRRETTERVGQVYRRVSENAANGRAEEILRMDGLRRGRELSDTGAEREATPRSNGTVSGKGSGSDLGEQFTAYAKQLRDNAKVLVGTYRTEALEKAGKDAGLSSITKERGDK
ncbi:MAG: hypothetical protein E7C72_05840 [Dialister sp.]|nr:hypothetical protein [Dialister sp.]